MRELLRVLRPVEAVPVALLPLDFFFVVDRPLRKTVERAAPLGNLPLATRPAVARPPDLRDDEPRATGPACFLADRTSAVTNCSLRIECQPARPICLANSPSSLTVCVLRSAAVIKGRYLHLTKCVTA